MSIKFMRASITRVDAHQQPEQARFNHHVIRQTTNPHLSLTFDFYII